MDRKKKRKKNYKFRKKNRLPPKISQMKDILYDAVLKCFRAIDAQEMLKYIQPLSTPISIAMHMHMQMYVALWNGKEDRGREYFLSLQNMIDSDYIPEQPFPRKEFHEWILTNERLPSVLGTLANSYNEFLKDLIHSESKLERCRTRWINAIDRIMVLNLPSRTDRKEHMHKQFLAYHFPMDKIEWVDAIWNENGAVGASCTHESALDMIIQRGYKKICLTLEDDIEWRVSALQVHQHLANFVIWSEGNSDVKPWMVCNLTMHVQSYGLQNEEIRLGSAAAGWDTLLKRVKEGCEAAAYFINPLYANTLKENVAEGCQYLKATGRHWEFAIDQYWKRLQKDDGYPKWYVMVPMLCDQLKETKSNPSNTSKHSQELSSITNDPCFQIDQLLSCVTVDSNAVKIWSDMLPVLDDFPKENATESTELLWTAAFPFFQGKSSPHTWRHLQRATLKDGTCLWAWNKNLVRHGRVWVRIASSIDKIKNLDAVASQISLLEIKKNSGADATSGVKKTPQPIFVVDLERRQMEEKANIVLDEKVEKPAAAESAVADKEESEVYGAVLCVAEQHTPKVLEWWKAVQECIGTDKAYLLFFNDTTTKSAREMKSYPNAEHVLALSQEELKLANPFQKGTWFNTETHLVLWWRWMKNTHHLQPASVIVLDQHIRSLNYEGSFKCIPKPLLKCDFLAKHVERYMPVHNKGWYWWHRFEWTGPQETLPKVEEAWKCFRPFMRLSSAMMELLSKNLGISTAYGEVYLPTLAVRNGLKVGCLNHTPVFSPGKFEPDGKESDEDTLAFTMTDTGLYYPIKQT